MHKEPSNIKNVIVTWIIYTLAAVWLVITIYPLVFLVQNSLKQSMEFFTGTVWSLPQKFSLANYQRVWESNFPRFFFNSALVTTVSLTMILLAGSAAGSEVSQP